MRRCGLARLVVLSAVLAGCATTREPVETRLPSVRREVVVLLHGLGRTSHSMAWLAWDLETRGYDVINLDYPSRAHRVEVLADQVHAELSERLAPGVRVSFVTHSLGGIVARALLARHPLPGAHRLVMLGPPNQGSEIAEQLRERALYRWLTGPAGQQLGTGPGSIAWALPEVPIETGVIAGRCSVNPLFSPFLPGEDDGAVTVERAGAPGMSDMRVLCQPHTFLMYGSETRRAVARFLAMGSFGLPASEDASR